MITHKYKNDQVEIKVESAENVDDAKKNGFPEGISSRYILNGKPVNNYMAMIRFIVDETGKTGSRFIPSSTAELKKLQRQIIMQQKNEIMKQFQEVKKQYAQMNVPENVLKQIDESMDKLDLAGVRVSE